MACYLKAFTQWPLPGADQVTYKVNPGVFSFDLNSYSASDQSTFENDSNKRIVQYIEIYKIKKGAHKNKQIKVVYKAKYKVTTDKKNGRPKEWKVMYKGKSGLSTSDAQNIFENQNWLCRIQTKQEWWEPIPAELLPIPNWYYDAFEQYGGKMDALGAPASTTTPDMTGFNGTSIAWPTGYIHDAGFDVGGTGQKVIFTNGTNVNTIRKAGTDVFEQLSWEIYKDGAAVALPPVGFNADTDLSGSLPNNIPTANDYEFYINPDDDIFAGGGDFTIRAYWFGSKLDNNGASLTGPNDSGETITNQISFMINDAGANPVTASIDDGETAEFDDTLPAAGGGDTGVIDIEADAAGEEGNKTLDFDGSSDVDTIAAATGGVVVNSGGSEVPANGTSATLGGGEDPMPEIPTSILQQFDDYILLRYGPTNHIELPVTEWLEFPDVPSVEVYWDLTDLNNGGSGDKAVLTENNVGQGIAENSGGNTSSTNVATPIQVTTGGNHNRYRGKFPAEYTNHSDWDSKKATWIDGSPRHSTHSRDQLKKIKLNNSGDTGKRGFVKTWTGPPEPRIVLIANANLIRAYGTHNASYCHGLHTSNGRLNYIKVKGCTNIENWANAFYTDGSDGPDLTVDFREWVPGFQTQWNGMFQNSRIKYIVMSKGSSIVADSMYAANMFQNCDRLTGYEIPDIVPGAGAGIGTANYSNMFYGCTSLTSAGINFLRYEARAHMINCDYMFTNCTSLTHLTAQYMVWNNPSLEYMFRNCSSLQHVNGNGTWTVICTSWSSLEGMFYGCSSLANNTMTTMFDSWAFVRNPRKLIDTNNQYYDQLTQSDYDGYIDTGTNFAKNAGFTVKPAMTDIVDKGSIPLPAAWQGGMMYSSVPWVNALTIEVDLRLSPNRTHEKTWMPGVDLTSINTTQYPWSGKRVEFKLGYGPGYNAEGWDLLIDWGDGTTEWINSLNEGYDPRYVNQAQYQSRGHDYFTTGHNIITHDYANKGVYTIKVLGCSSQFHIGGRQQYQDGGGHTRCWDGFNSGWVTTKISSLGAIDEYGETGFCTPVFGVESRNLEQMSTAYNFGIGNFRFNGNSANPYMPNLSQNPEPLATITADYNTSGWSNITDKLLTTCSFDPTDTYYPIGGNIDYTGYADGGPTHDGTISGFPGAGSDSKRLDYLYYSRKAGFYMTIAGSLKTWYYPDTSPDPTGLGRDPRTQTLGAGAYGMPLHFEYMNTPTTAGFAEIEQCSPVLHTMSNWPELLHYRSEGPVFNTYNHTYVGAGIPNLPRNDYF